MNSDLVVVDGLDELILELVNGQTLSLLQDREVRLPAEGALRAADDVLLPFREIWRKSARFSGRGHQARIEAAGVDGIEPVLRRPARIFSLALLALLHLELPALLRERALHHRRLGERAVGVFHDSATNGG